jgi:hypothetical protein
MPSLRCWRWRLHVPGDQVGGRPGWEVWLAQKWGMSTNYHGDFSWDISWNITNNLEYVGSQNGGSMYGHLDVDNYD